MGAVVGGTALLAAAAWELGVVGLARRPVVLVVGDSLVVGAGAELVARSTPAVGVSVLAGIGASPCEMLSGYRQPDLVGGGELSYRKALGATSPRAVVLAFSGNPGLTAHACVPDGRGDYPLGQLLAAYRAALSRMGELAESVGAQVYLAAVPARNPDVFEGWDGTTQYGYNGDPAINTMLAALAKARGWIFDRGAEQALAGSGAGWTLRQPCLPGEVACHDGQAQVRMGDTDPIHCDAPGTNGPESPSAGSVRFAAGLLGAPLSDLGSLPPGARAGTVSCSGGGLVGLGVGRKGGRLPVRLDQPAVGGDLGVGRGLVPSEQRSHEARGLLGHVEPPVGGLGPQPQPTQQHVVEMARPLVQHGVHHLDR